MGNGEAPADRPPWWARGPEILPRPVPGARFHFAFDLVVGVLLPPALFLLVSSWDPLETMGIRRIPFRPYCPLAACASIAVLVAWRLLRARIDWIDAFAAGPLFAGALLALGLGLVLLPLAILGTVIAIVGVLGFTPLLTARVFAGAGREALARALPRFGRAPSLAVALCTGLLFTGACAAAGRAVRIVEIRQTEVLTGERDGDPERAVRLLRALHRFPGLGLRALADAARRDPKADRAAAVDPAGAYERITGHPVPEKD